VCARVGVAHPFGQGHLDVQRILHGTGLVALDKKQVKAKVLIARGVRRPRGETRAGMQYVDAEAQAASRKRPLGRRLQVRDDSRGS